MSDRDWTPSDPAASTDRPMAAVVTVDVWKHQNEPDLHAAIVERVLSLRPMWYPYGWLRFPLSLFFIRLVKELRLSLSAGSQTKTQLEIPLTLPRLTGQHALETAVARCRQRGWRTVIVLDEVDRAAPPVA